MSESHILTFLQPADQLNLNDRRHRMANAKLVAAWRERAYWAACEWRTSPSARRLTSFPVAIQCVFPVHTRSRRDPHNWAPTVKAIIDGLTSANLWPDDNANFVRVHDSTFLTVSRDPRHQTVTVILQEAAPEYSLEPMSKLIHPTANQ